MKCRTERLKKFIIKNKWILLGFVLVSLFLFSNYFYGYKLSFSNANYSFAPFNSYGIKTEGPILTDIADNHYPLVHNIFYSNEKISLWESDVTLGRTNNVFAEIMNPMEWVYLMPFETAIFLKAFSEFALAFFAMFLFMQTIGVKRYSAALSGVIYAFSATMVAWLGWQHSDVAAWAPLLFFAIEKMIVTMKIKYMLLMSLSVYVMLIVGMPTYAAYFLYLAGAYIVIFTILRYRKERKNILIIAGMFTVGIILAGLASLPYTGILLENVVSNGYTQSREYLGEEKLGIEYLRTFLFPYIRDGFTLHFNESTLYAGIISVIILPLAFCNVKKKKRNIFFIVATVIVFLLIFTDSLTFIYTKLPLINTSRKYRVITLLMFTLSILSGISLNDIFVNRKYYIKKAWLLIPTGIWICGVVYLASKDIYPSHSTEVIMLIGFIILLTICLLMLVKRNFKIFYIILAILIMADSIQFAKDYLPWIDANAEIIPEATDTVDYLMENTQGEERIAGVGVWVLFPNSTLYYGLNDIRTHGFEATNPDMVEYFNRIDETSYPSRTRTEFHNINNYELIKYLGVKYIYGLESSESSIINENVKQSECKAVYSGKDNLTVYEFEEYSPKVELIETVNVLSTDNEVIDKMSEEYIPNTLFMTENQEREGYSIPISENESVQLLEYSDDYIKILCSTEYDRYLMLNDYYNSDWKAYIDGEKTDIKKANYLIRAVKLEQGEDIVVEFKYEPNRVYVIVAISMSVILLSVVLFLFRRKIQNKLDKIVELS